MTDKIVSNDPPTEVQQDEASMSCYKVDDKKYKFNNTNVDTDNVPLSDSTATKRKSDFTSFEINRPKEHCMKDDSSNLNCNTIEKQQIQVKKCIEYKNICADLVVTNTHLRDATKRDEEKPLANNSLSIDKTSSQIISCNVPVLDKDDSLLTHVVRSVKFEEELINASWTSHTSKVDKYVLNNTNDLEVDNMQPSTTTTEGTNMLTSNNVSIGKIEPQKATFYNSPKKDIVSLNEDELTSTVRNTDENLSNILIDNEGKNKQPSTTKNDNLLTSNNISLEKVKPEEVTFQSSSKIDSSSCKFEIPTSNASEVNKSLSNYGIDMERNNKQLSTNKDGETLLISNNILLDKDESQKYTVQSSPKNDISSKSSEALTLYANKGLSDNATDLGNNDSQQSTTKDDENLSTSSNVSINVFEPQETTFQTSPKNHASPLNIIALTSTTSKVDKSLSNNVIDTEVINTDQFTNKNDKSLSTSNNVSIDVVEHEKDAFQSLLKNEISSLNADVQISIAREVDEGLSDNATDLEVIDSQQSTTKNDDNLSTSNNISIDLVEPQSSTTTQKDENMLPSNNVSIDKVELQEATSQGSPKNDNSSLNSGELTSIARDTDEHLSDILIDIEANNKQSSNTSQKNENMLPSNNVSIDVVEPQDVTTHSSPKNDASPLNSGELTSTARDTNKDLSDILLDIEANNKQSSTTTQKDENMLPSNNVLIDEVKLQEATSQGSPKNDNSSINSGVLTSTARETDKNLSDIEANNKQSSNTTQKYENMLPSNNVSIDEVKLQEATSQSSPKNDNSSLNYGELTSTARNTNKDLSDILIDIEANNKQSSNTTQKDENMLLSNNVSIDVVGPQDVTTHSSPKNDASPLNSGELTSTARDTAKDLSDILIDIEENKQSSTTTQKDENMLPTNMVSIDEVELQEATSQSSLTNDNSSLNSGELTSTARDTDKDLSDILIDIKANNKQSSTTTQKDENMLPSNNVSIDKVELQEATSQGSSKNDNSSVNSGVVTSTARDTDKDFSDILVDIEAGNKQSSTTTQKDENMLPSNNVSINKVELQEATSQGSSKNDNSSVNPGVVTSTARDTDKDFSDILVDIEASNKQSSTTTQKDENMLPNNNVSIDVVEPHHDSSLNSGELTSTARDTDKDLSDILIDIKANNKQSSTTTQKDENMLPSNNVSIDKVELQETTSQGSSKNDNSSVNSGVVTSTARDTDKDFSDILVDIEASNKQSSTTTQKDENMLPSNNVSIDKVELQEATSQGSSKNDNSSVNPGVVTSTARDTDKDFSDILVDIEASNKQSSTTTQKDENILPNNNFSIDVVEPQDVTTHSSPKNDTSPLNSGELTSTARDTNKDLSDIEANNKQSSTSTQKDEDMLPSNIVSIDKVELQEATSQSSPKNDNSSLNSGELTSTARDLSDILIDIESKIKQSFTTQKDENVSPSNNVSIDEVELQEATSQGSLKNNNSSLNSGELTSTATDTDKDLSDILFGIEAKIKQSSTRQKDESILPINNVSIEDIQPQETTFQSSPKNHISSLNSDVLTSTDTDKDLSDILFDIEAKIKQSSTTQKDESILPINNVSIEDIQPQETTFQSSPKNHISSLNSDVLTSTDTDKDLSDILFDIEAKIKQSSTTQKDESILPINNVSIEDIQPQETTFQSSPKNHISSLNSDVLTSTDTDKDLSDILFDIEAKIKQSSTTQKDESILPINNVSIEDIQPQETTFQSSPKNHISSLNSDVLTSTDTDKDLSDILFDIEAKIKQSSTTQQDESMLPSNNVSIEDVKLQEATFQSSPKNDISSLNSGVLTSTVTDTDKDLSDILIDIESKIKQSSNTQKDESMLPSNNVSIEDVKPQGATFQRLSKDEFSSLSSGALTSIASEVNKSISNIVIVTEVNNTQQSTSTKNDENLLTTNNVSIGEVQPCDTAFHSSPTKDISSLKSEVLPSIANEVDKSLSNNAIQLEVNNTQPSTSVDKDVNETQSLSVDDPNSGHPLIIIENDEEILKPCTDSNLLDKQILSKYPSTITVVHTDEKALGINYSNIIKVKKCSKGKKLKKNAVVLEKNRTSNICSPAKSANKEECSQFVRSHDKQESVILTPSIEKFTNKCNHKKSSRGSCSNCVPNFTEKNLACSEKRSILSDTQHQHKRIKLENNNSSQLVTNPYVLLSDIGMPGQPKHITDIQETNDFSPNNADLKPASVENTVVPLELKICEVYSECSIFSEDSDANDSSCAIDAGNRIKSKALWKEIKKVSPCKEVIKVDTGNKDAPNPCIKNKTKIQNDPLIMEYSCTENVSILDENVLCNKNKSPNAKANRKRKSTGFKSKSKRRSTDKRNAHIDLHIELPTFLKFLNDYDSSLIVTRERKDEEGTKIKVQCLVFEDTVLDWAFTDTLLSSMDNNKTLRQKLKVSTNLVFPSHSKSREMLHPVSIDENFPFSMPSSSSTNASDNSVGLPYPLEMVSNLCPSVTNIRKSGQTSQKTIELTQEPLEWAFKETLLSSFVDSPILTNILGLPSSAKTWPDVSSDLLGQLEIDYTFPFCCSNNRKNIERLLFSSLPQDIPANLMENNLWLSSIPPHIDGEMKSCRETLLRLLAIASYHAYQSHLPAIKCNQQISVIISALVASFKPLIVSAANNYAEAIEAARKATLEGITSDDVDALETIVRGPISYSKRDLYSVAGIARLQRSVARNKKSKLKYAK